MIVKKIVLLSLFSLSMNVFSAVHSSTSAFTSLEGKILCGYQGWFACPGDGTSQGWKHYTADGMFRPGACSIDMWPDVRELDADERFDTPFTNPDGTPAQVYSSYKKKSVVRHFRWMNEYGIDGVILQRFVTNIRSNNSLRAFNDTILRNVMEGAKQNNRAWCIMYDMTSMKTADAAAVKEDWKRIIEKYNVTTSGDNQPYLYHRGKPLVCLWGVGFDDGRHDPASSSSYSMACIKDLVDFFKNDPTYGGCSVLLGVNYKWRAATGKSYIDDELFNIIKMSDVINPWLVGRIKSISDMSSYGTYIQGDLGWCNLNGVDYIPCAFPGFQWLNMAFRDPSKGTNIIGRAKGDFLWKQFHQAISKGVKQIYATMFDEIDEATALFKITDTPPNNINGNNEPNKAIVGNYPASVFQNMEGLRSDFYLWLVGEATRMLKKETVLSNIIPERSDKYNLGDGVVLSVVPLEGGMYGLMYNGNLSSGKIYCSNAYTVEYGAPSYGIKRDARYFGTPVTKEGIAVYGTTGQIVTVVRVDNEDRVIGYDYIELPALASVVSHERENESVKVYYDSVSESLRVLGLKNMQGKTHIRLLGMDGRLNKIYQCKKYEDDVQISVPSLTGVYFVEIIDQKTRFAKKIMIN